MLLTNKRKSFALLIVFAFRATAVLGDTIVEFEVVSVKINPHLLVMEHLKWEIVLEQKIVMREVLSIFLPWLWKDHQTLWFYTIFSPPDFNSDFSFFFVINGFVIRVFFVNKLSHFVPILPILFMNGKKSLGSKLYT